MRTDNALFQNCTDSDILGMLDVCPTILSVLSKRKEIIDSYDDLAYSNGIRFGVEPIYKGNTDRIHHFEFWVHIDGNKRQPEEEYATKSEAQLRAVHETMYELEHRLVSK